MDLKQAENSFAALGTESRLAVLQTLSKAGKEGLPSGDLARRLGIAQNTLSTQLFLLSKAGFVTAERDGRNKIYRVNYDTISDVITFLAKDCAGGRISAEIRKKT